MASLGRDVSQTLSKNNGSIAKIKITLYYNELDKQSRPTHIHYKKRKEVENRNKLFDNY